MADKLTVSAVYGRVMSAIMGVVSVGLLYIGNVELSPEDQAAVIDIGSQAIDAGYVFSAKITAGISAGLALLSKYREGK